MIGLKILLTGLVVFWSAIIYAKYTMCEVGDYFPLWIMWIFGIVTTLSGVMITIWTF